MESQIVQSSSTIQVDQLNPLIRPLKSKQILLLTPPKGKKVKKYEYVNANKKYQIRQIKCLKGITTGKPQKYSKRIYLNLKHNKQDGIWRFSFFQLMKKEWADKILKGQQIIKIFRKSVSQNQSELLKDYNEGQKFNTIESFQNYEIDLSILPLFQKIKKFVRINIIHLQRGFGIYCNRKQLWLTLDNIKYQKRIQEFKIIARVNDSIPFTFKSTWITKLFPLRNLKVLDLFSGNYQPEELRDLSKLIQLQGQLKEIKLGLKYKENMSQDFQKISQAISELELIQKVEFELIQSELSVESLGSILNNLKKCKTIKTFNIEFEDCDFRENALKIFGEFLNETKLENLKFTLLCSQILDNEIKYFSECFTNANNNLKQLEIDLREKFITNEEFYQLCDMISKHKQLEKFIFKINSPYTTQECVEYLTIAISQLNNLNEFYFTSSCEKGDVCDDKDSIITEKGLFGELFQLKQVQKILLAQSVNISNHMFSNSVPNFTIKELNLQFGFSGILTTETAKELSLCLSNAKVLSILILDLSYNSNLNYDRLQAIGNGLSKCQNLTKFELNLDHCFIKDDGLLALKKVTSKQLESIKLILKSNELTDNCSQFLGDSANFKQILNKLVQTFKENRGKPRRGKK